MQALKVYRDAKKGLPDLLDWAALIDSGLVQGKSGSLMAGYFYRGTDTQSSTPSERNYITSRVNAALSRLGSGWVTWHDAVRMPSTDYPEKIRSHFPDQISQMIDNERRADFQSEDAHYESEYAIIFYFTPLDWRKEKIKGYIWNDEEDSTTHNVADESLSYFLRTLTQIEDTLGDVVKMRRMASFTLTDDFGQEHLHDDLVNYLNFCLTGKMLNLIVPRHGMYLDKVIGGVELWHGDTPRIGDNYVCSISIEGYPAETYPNILEVLEYLPIAYRWSTRFIYLDQQDSIAEIGKYKRKWTQRVKGFWTQVFKIKDGKINEDALMMANETLGAETDNSSGLVTFGYYTPTIILNHHDRKVLLNNARFVSRELGRIGFNTRIESVAATEVWHGSLPGHPFPNVMRPLIHTLALADLLPLSSVWPGLENNPCPFYPEESPPLAVTATTGATPFRLNLHVSDVGMVLIFGPIGSGKSTLLAFIAAQFRRYENATITAFDKGRSMYALVKACGGNHYDIGTDHSQRFTPLGELETGADIAWADEWVATCFELQTGHGPEPHQISAIHQAMTLLQNSEKGFRSLTEFIATVQDDEVKAALEPYSLTGPLGDLLDATEDGITSSNFNVFEVEELMNMGEKNLIPVLLYLFRRFEKSLKGQPALLILDEAWVMLGHPVFREKIREWLKVLRKANCSVVIATQSLSDALKSNIFDVLIESCPTKILLPNTEADKKGNDEFPGPLDVLRMFGVNDTQVNILKNAQRKRHYYYMSPEGNRLFDLGLGKAALAFMGISDKTTLAHIKELEQTHADQWPFQWLKENGVDYEKLL